MIYSIFGYGKMKTESAVGCTIRAIQNGEDVLFVQFLKDGKSSEIEFFKDYGCVYTLVGNIDKVTLPHNLTTVDKFKAQCLFTDMVKELAYHKPKLLVADELLPAVDMGLITIEHMEDYVAVGFTLNRCATKPVLKSEVKPQDLHDIGDYLSKKWNEEVINKVNEIVIKFAEENGLLPVGQIDIVGTSTLASVLSQNEMISMGAKISSMRGVDAE